jgi:hypothetical protein
MDIDPQTVGRYRIVERVGRGSMGVVYRAIDPKLDREVAIKIMAADLFGDIEEETRQRFLREARAAAKLQHRNIVTVFEYDEHDGMGYIVMEFLRGESLASRLKSGRRVSVDQTIDIASGVCTGLEFAHRNGVIHRDVKPGNIWLNDDGTVKLLDFGIARLGTATITSDGRLRGSACYMAPEQIRGDPVDGRTDIFAIAVVLFELLAGRLPFESTSPPATIRQILHEPTPRLEVIAPGIPQPLVVAVDKGLAKDPAERYQTAGDLAYDLQMIRLSTPERTQVEAPSPAPPQPPPAPAQVPGMGRITPRILVAGVGLVVVVGVVALLTARGKKAPEGLAAAPPPAAPVHVRVEAEPPDVTIRIDGIDIGRATPADLTIPAPGPQRIQASKAGYEPIDRPITAAEINAGVIHFKLTSTPIPTVRLRAKADYPFEIVDGDRVISRENTTHDVNVVPSRALSFRSTKYFLKMPINLTQSSSPFQLPALGSIQIRAVTRYGACEARVDGLHFGSVDDERQVVAGRHQAQIVCDGKIELGKEFDVQPGRNSPVTMR